MRALQYFLIFLIALLGFNLARAAVVVNPTISEDLFACNAGIMHAGTALRGTDYIQVQYEDMTVDKEHPAHFRGNTLESNSTITSYQMLFSNTDLWLRRITSLNFSFSSEKTGASYFVDFCYLGPLEDLKMVNNKQKDMSEAIYNLNASLASTSLTKESNYRDQVRLQAKVEFVCDLRGRGKETAPRAVGQTNPGNFEGDNVSYNDFSSISAAGLASEQLLNQNPQQVPRFCRLRASFSEAQIMDRSTNSANTEMTIFLDIQKAQ